MANQLTSEDYENIWLRIKDKYMRWVFTVVSIVAVLSGFTGYKIAQATIDNRVAKYLLSDTFKSQVISEVRGNLARLLDDNRLSRSRIDALHDDAKSIENKIEAYKQFPLKVTDHGFSVIGSQGKKIIVEYGRVKGIRGVMSETPVTISFKSHFSRPPVLLFSTNSQVRITTGIVSIRKEDATFFIGVENVVSDKNIGINWLAIGQ